MISLWVQASELHFLYKHIQTSGLGRQLLALDSHLHPHLRLEQCLEIAEKYDFEFHEILVSNCDSANLMSIHSNLLDRHRRYQTILHQNRGQKSILEHEEIFNAVLNKDIKKTIKILQIHLDQGLEKALALFKK